MSEIAKPLGTAARPSVLSLTIREKSALFAAYMPFLKSGGIFIPTSKVYHLGDEVFMLLTLMDDPAKIAVAGTVIWLTPAGATNNRTQGIGVQFNTSETGHAAKVKIENLLGGAIQSTRTTHTM